MTCEALSAFLEQGYTHRGNHPFRLVQRRGIRWLLGQQDAQGGWDVGVGEEGLEDLARAVDLVVAWQACTRSVAMRPAAVRALAHLRDRLVGPGGHWTRSPPGLGSARLVGRVALAVLDAAALVDTTHLAGTHDGVRDDARLLRVLRDWAEEVVSWASHPGALQAGVDAPIWVAPAALILRRHPHPSRHDGPNLDRMGDVLRAHVPWASQGPIDLEHAAMWCLALDTSRRSTDRRLRDEGARAWRGLQRTDGQACTYLGSWDATAGRAGGRMGVTARMGHALSMLFRYHRVERFERRHGGTR